MDEEGYNILTVVFWVLVLAFALAFSWFLLSVMTVGFSYCWFRAVCGMQVEGALANAMPAGLALGALLLILKLGQRKK